jgi:hypothetical protein
VQLNGREWFYTIHNTVYHNSWTSGFNGSGISYYVVQCIEAGGTNCFTSAIAGQPANAVNYTPSGNDLSANQSAGYYPFHNVVAWNVSYNNRINYNKTPSPLSDDSLLSPLAQFYPVICNGHTDGNGIIIDTFYDGFSNTLAYPYETLVMNNVAYYNGGRGIHVFQASNVTVANNSVFNNITDTCFIGKAPGELSMVGGTNNVWINNLSQGVTNINNNACSMTAGLGLTDVNTSYNNQVINGLNGSPCLFGNDKTYFSCSNNKCNTDPGYVNATAGVAGVAGGAPTGGTWIPGNDDLALSGTSPAINYTYSPPPSWLPSQNTDAGACHHSLTTCPNPGTSKY